MRKVNKYLEIKAPWKTIKVDSSQKSQSATTLYVAADIVRISAQLLKPVMPYKIDEIINMLGSNYIKIDNYSTGLLKPGSKLGEGQSPFPRIVL